MLRIQGAAREGARAVLQTGREYAAYGAESKIWTYGAGR
jgi:hypothetical protein